MSSIERIRVIDSHTGGEPTRVVLDCPLELMLVPMERRLELFKRKFDWLRNAVVNEPRGSDVVVGAMLMLPRDREVTTGVIFFNNVGYLGMCGHGTIGLVRTLAHIGAVGPGEVDLETPVGKITTILHDDMSVSVFNVPAYRYIKAVTVKLPGSRQIVGDVAWGGNWFFLTEAQDMLIDIEHVSELTAYTETIKSALKTQGITGKDYAEIDHVELFSHTPTADSRNFVLCPGGAYDRSPCGTGTSAKMACLFQDGLLKETEIWRQESIIGSIFVGSIRKVGKDLIPTIRGTAHITAESTLFLNHDDPFRHGIVSR